jgi:hypothetical protein
VIQDGFNTPDEQQETYDLLLWLAPRGGRSLKASGMTSRQPIWFLVRLNGPGSEHRKVAETRHLQCNSPCFQHKPACSRRFEERPGPPE